MKTFDNIEWGSHFKGFRGVLSINKFYKLSVVCGKYYYCSPREKLANFTNYDSYEVAVLDFENDFCTKDFVDCDDDVLGGKTKEEINALIRIIESK